MAGEIKIVFFQPQPLPYLFHFLHEMSGGPKAAVIGLIAVPGVQLVIVNELDPFSWQEVLERLEEFVCAAGTAMQEQYLDTGVVAEAFCPDVEFSFGRGDLHQPYVTRLHTGILGREIVLYAYALGGLLAGGKTTGKKEDEKISHM